MDAKIKVICKECRPAMLIREAEKPVRKRRQSSSSSSNNNSSSSSNNNNNSSNNNDSSSSSSKISILVASFAGLLSGGKERKVPTILS